MIKPIKKLKLNRTLYDNDGYISDEKYEYSELFARKGELFSLYKTDEQTLELFGLDKDYLIEDNIKFILVSNNPSKWFYSESGNEEWFDEI